MDTTLVMRKIYIAILLSLCVGICYYGLMYAERHKHYIVDSSLENKITKIVVEKHKRVLHLYHNDTLLKSYASVALGKNPIGHKQFEGDKKTPEGLYYIDSKNPKSRYFLNLGISYPNKSDTEYAKKYQKSAGGDIKIHGLPNGMSVAKDIFATFGDWTDGCIALPNESMYELYHVVKIGTPILILP